MVLREFLGLVDLTRAQAFCIYKLTEVVIVSKDKDLIFAAFYVVSSSFKSVNDGYKLLIVSLISSLCKNHFLKKKKLLDAIEQFRNLDLCRSCDQNNINSKLSD